MIAREFLIRSRVHPDSSCAPGVGLSTVTDSDGGIADVHDILSRNQIASPRAGELRALREENLPDEKISRTFSM